VPKFNRVVRESTGSEITDTLLARLADMPKGSARAGNPLARISQSGPFLIEVTGYMVWRSVIVERAPFKQPRGLLINE
jgi:hypothetical protein